MRVASIGEGMIELRDGGEGTLRRSFGGDTLNTAVYLARLGVAVDYLSALGDDPFSDELLAAWRAEGIGTALVARLAGRVPGLYAIRTDADGERHFYYWRGEAPARALFAPPLVGRIAPALASYDWLYLSGITLSLYGAQGRAALLAAVDAARAGGTRVAFDTNYRPVNWPDPATARRAMREMAPRIDLALSGTEDEAALFGPDSPPGHWLIEAGVAEIVVKQGHEGCVILSPTGGVVRVPAAPVARVIDTTAAGDSFNAGYLAARLRGAAPEAAARAGHLLAAVVIQHSGAIVPRAAMPAGLPAPTE